MSDGQPPSGPPSWDPTQQHRGTPPPDQPPPQWGTPPGQQPYGYQPPAATKTNPLAIASLVLAVLCGGLSAPIAIPLGVVALSQIKKSNGAQSGRGLAIAGIVVSAVFGVIVVGSIMAITVFGDSVEDRVDDQLDDICEQIDSDGDGINDCDDTDFDFDTTFTTPDLG